MGNHVFILCKCQQSIHIVCSTTIMTAQAHLKSAEQPKGPPPATPGIKSGGKGKGDSNKGKGNQDVGNTKGESKGESRSRSRSRTNDPGLGREPAQDEQPD